MQHGIVILPELPWAQERDRWIRAEEYGFAHAWTYDHLSWLSLADYPWRGAIPTLTAAATVTSKMRIGPLVASPNFRHPVPFAKEVVGVDEISGGRLILGLGSGADASDSYVIGQPSLTNGERFRKFEAFVDDLDSLLRFEVEPVAPSSASGISFTDDWYTARNARMPGNPEQHPRTPFLIAANGPRGLALASRIGDGWVTTGRAATTMADWWSGVGQLAAAMNEALNARTTGASGFQRMLSLDAAPRFSLSSFSFAIEARERAAELGFTDVISHWPRRWGVYAGSEGVLDELAAVL
jgi:alkanesulfonate monooxygenase SsuD/methylene tetrahydromethanopterin reductase-like flavin-dependent oxidoreductase (luciferase family)